MTGASRREINRKGNILEIASKALKEAKCAEDCEVWRQHSNSKVRMLAWAVSIKLPARANLPTQAPTEFDILVERFRAEGKKDPIKSARASMAATANARKRMVAQANP